MSLDLSRMQQKTRKWIEWTELLHTIASDPDGEAFLSEVFSSNGNNSNSKLRATPKKKSEKTQRRMNAIWEACVTFQHNFGLRDLIEALQKQNFQFRRGDPSVEIGAALRELVGEQKLSVVRERHGTLGRLYQRVSQ